MSRTAAFPFVLQPRLGPRQIETSGRGIEMAKTVNKSAKTGRFVKSTTVQKNPGTTYKQTVKKGK